MILWFRWYYTIWVEITINNCQWATRTTVEFVIAENKSTPWLQGMHFRMHHKWKQFCILCNLRAENQLNQQLNLTSSFKSYWLRIPVARWNSLWNESKFHFTLLLTRRVLFRFITQFPEGLIPNTMIRGRKMNAVYIP